MLDKYLKFNIIELMFEFQEKRRKKSVIFFLFLMFGLFILIILTRLQLNHPSSYKSKAAESNIPETLSFAAYYNLIGQNMTLSLPTDLPNSINDIKFFVIKKNPSTTRSNNFGVSGVQGEWDVLSSQVTKYNTYWGSNKTGDEMLDRHFAMLSALGISWIRWDMNWQRPEEPTEGVFNWAYTDKMFAAAKKYNLKVLSSILYTPSWNYTHCVDKTSIANSPWDLDTSGSVRFNRYITNLVNRYKPNGTYYNTHPSSDESYGLSYWQIGNEYEGGVTWWRDCQTGGAASLAKYAWLLKSAYDSIKLEDPGAKVVLNGYSHLDPINSLTVTYTALVNDKKFDILDMHSYESADAMAVKITAFAQVRNGKSDNSKEIWLSETSATNVPSDPENSGQSDYMKAMFGKFEVLSPNYNLGKAFWWSSREYWFPDNGETKNTPDTALFENNFYPRKVYFELGQWLGTTQKKGEITATVNNNLINVTIPGNYFNETGEYVVFYASKSKMVTASPVKVLVVTTLPTVTVTNTPTSPPAPSPTPISTSPTPCPNRSKGDANCDGLINNNDFNIWRCQFLDNC